ncbi:MAG: hypothetical protein ILO34_01650, partial [Kiritimatiellae bacterium]|nr:hypothetical protein [Kiritimatiellia bacterium]
SVFVHREDFRVGLGRFRVRRQGAASRDDARRADGAESVNLPSLVCEAKRRKASMSAVFV